MTKFIQKSIFSINLKIHNNFKKQTMSQVNQNPAGITNAQRISLVINQDERGYFELIEKPFQNNPKALQFPCGSVVRGNDSLSAAHKALVKGDQYQNLSFMERFEYADEYGTKEVFMFRGNSTPLPMNQSSYRTVYMPKDRVLGSSLVTELSKEAFRRYMEHTK